MASNSKKASKQQKVSAKARKKERESQQSRHQQQYLILAAIGVLVVVAGLFLMNSGNQMTYQERFDLDPVLGNPDASVTIIEYAAYGCPACGEWHKAGVIDQILEEYAGDVKFIFRDMPIIMPAYSQWSAEVAQCALDQGNNEFWDFHHAIYDYAEMGVSTQAQLIALGEQIGLDGDALRSCVDANTHADTVRYDLNRGRELGINSAPVFFVNGQRLFNASPAMLRTAVESALRG
jgi:protein-disulfide isomerase